MREHPNTNPNPIHYLHLRYQDKDGSVSNHGGITIAWREHENGKALEVAMARCNLKDNFNKKIGRSIARGNLNWDRLWITPKPVATAPNSDRKLCHEAAIAIVQAKLREIFKVHSTETLH